MKYIRSTMRGLSSDKKAVTALEYALIASVIAVVLIGGFKTFFNTVSTTMNNVATSVAAG